MQVKHRTKELRKFKIIFVPNPLPWLSPALHPPSFSLLSPPSGIQPLFFLRLDLEYCLLCCSFDFPLAKVWGLSATTQPPQNSGKCPSNFPSHLIPHVGYLRIFASCPPCLHFSSGFYCYHVCLLTPKVLSNGCNSSASLSELAQSSPIKSRIAFYSISTESCFSLVCILWRSQLQLLPEQTSPSGRSAQLPLPILWRWGLKSCYGCFGWKGEHFRIVHDSILCSRPSPYSRV